MRTYLVFLMLALFSMATQADVALHPFTASYTVQLNGFKVGELTRSLQRLDDGSYRLKTQAYTTGLTSLFKPDVVTEVSLMRMEEGRPLSLRYDYHYTGRRKDVVERQEFDWQQGRLSSLRDGKTTVIDLPPGILDKQVFEIAMQQGLQRGIHTDNIQVAVRGRIRDYDYQVLGHERIVTRPFGEVETIKVARGATTMWLAPGHDYMLVRIKQKDRNSEAVSHILAVDYH